MKVPKLEAKVIPVKPTTERTPTAAIRLDTATRAHIAICGVLKPPCMKLSISGSSRSSAIPQVIPARYIVAPQQMGEMFNTSPANVIAGTRTLYNYLHLSVTPATALNHVVMYARALNMAPHHISTCEVLCKRISLQDSQLNTYTPSSLAAGVVMWTCQALGLPHTRKDVEAATSVSSVTISKCINAMAQIAGDLEERVAVRLRANEDGTVAVDFTVV